MQDNSYCVHNDANPYVIHRCQGAGWRDGFRCIGTGRGSARVICAGGRIGVGHRGTVRRGF